MKRLAIAVFVVVYPALAAAQTLSSLRAPATMPVDEPPAEPSSQPAAPDKGAFSFGSYGRMSVFTNQLGKATDDVNAVSRIPRLEKQPYLEMYLGFERRYQFANIVAMITPAFAGDLFHYTGQFGGQFSDHFALRNAFIEFQNLGGSGLFAWGGSRMYRGDNVPLLDYWALDELNTLGGGVGYRRGGFEGALHVGASRVIGTDFFVQQIVAPDPTSPLTTTQVDVNNRQHLIGSLKLSYYGLLGDTFAFKAKLYGEAHSIASGQIETDTQATQTLPSDSGWVFGGQLSFFRQNTRDYLHFFVRWGQDLGAYNALQVPYGLNAQGTSAGAHDLLISTAANLFFGERVGVMLGAFYHQFRSAVASDTDPNSTDELVGDVRLNVAVLRFFQMSGEISAQRTFPKGIDPRLLRQISPAIGKFSVIPTFVSGPENFPDFALRFIYTYTTSNDDTGYLYSGQDIRSVTRNYHFFGLQAEWLFEVRP